MRVVAAFALLMLAACGQPPAPTTYPPTTEINFMRACEAQSQIPGLCACTWDKIEAEVSPADLATVEGLPESERASHPVATRINGYANACRATLSREPAPAP